MQPALSPEELIRYSRHLILPEVGTSGQQKLKAAKVLLVGSGGLGSPAALYLAAAGVGKLGIVDFDTVDLSNLHRQIIHGTLDVGRRKVDSAQDALRSINPNVDVVKHDAMLSRENALEIIGAYDLVVDGTDNFATRYLVNDACVLLGKVNVYGSIFRFDGQATVFCAPGGPCYRCLYAEPPPPGMVPSCAEAGVLGVLPGIIGTIQATEAVKQILRVGKSLVGRLLLYDALDMSFQEVRIRRDPACPICGDNPTMTELDNYDQLCGLPIKSDSVDEIASEELRRAMDSAEPLQLIDVRERSEFETVSIPGSILIPLGELPSRLDDLERSANTVIHCHSGRRSAEACAILRRSGFSHVKNLSGGIAAWIQSGGDVLHGGTRTDERGGN